jgi:hypothetical protein
VVSSESRPDLSLEERTTKRFARFQPISDLWGSETSPAWDGIRELLHGIRAKFWA